MTSQYRHRRTSNPATVFPNPLEPGEITVNTANRQIAVGDAASATLGSPKALIAIRFFDIAAQYFTNDFVVNGTALYRANKPTGPGAFVAADWQMMVGTIDPQYVAKAGDVMTGSLSLPATAPTAGVHATNKTYVDNLVALKSSVLVSDVRPTPDPIDSTLWYNTRDGQLYIRYNDGNSVAWVIAAPQPDSSNYVSLIGSSAVRYDTAQALTTAQATQARVNIAAAPADALAYSGMQVNGSVEVSQEVGTAGVTLSGKYAADGWMLAKNGAAGVSLFQAVGSNVDVLPNFLMLSVSTAQPSFAAGEFLSAIQVIEGYRVSRLRWGTASAQPITIGFWTAHLRVGVYTVAVRNSASTRSYAASYTQNASSTWQYNTVTIPGCTDGGWPTNNTGGIEVWFTVAAGSSFIAPAANAWNSANYIAAPGQINGVAATTDLFRLTGVVVLPGTEAPSAARSPLIMRPYDQELLTCRRYWQRIDIVQGFYSPAAGPILRATVPLVPPMRDTPTMLKLTTAASTNVASALAYAIDAKGVDFEIQVAAAGDFQWQGSFSADIRL